MILSLIFSYEIEGCDVVWAVKDSSIVQTFVDEGAAEFLVGQLSESKSKDSGFVKRTKYTQEHKTLEQKTSGKFLL